MISVKVDPYFQTENLFQIISLNLTEFSPSYIVINVTLEHPNAITTSLRSPDSLEVQFIDTDYFIDLIDFVRVSNETSLRKEMPPQLTAEQHKKIEKLEATASNGFTIFASTNIVASVLLASGLKYFWGMINVL